MQSVQERAHAATGRLVELDRLQWLDQLDRAVEPPSRSGRQMLADLKAGANNTSADVVYCERDQVLAVCAMAAGSPAQASTPEPEAAEE